MAQRPFLHEYRCNHSAKAIFYCEAAQEDQVFKVSNKVWQYCLFEQKCVSSAACSHNTSIMLYVVQDMWQEVGIFHVCFYLC